jgi:1-acyl-sn-glycerol-3-phosphate acyltransferase
MMPATDFHYEPFPDIDRSLPERLGQYPRVPDLTWDSLRWLGRSLAMGLFHLQYRLQVIGSLPELPRVAMVANHSSHLDSIAVLAALPPGVRGRVAVLAARDYFFERRPPALGASLFAQAVAFDRTRYTELRHWSGVLREQKRGILLAYPSGSRRATEIHRALLLVLAQSGWPLVPVAIEGTAEAWPVGRRLWRPFRQVSVTFGGPVANPAASDLVATLAAFWDEHRRTEGSG